MRIYVSVGFQSWIYVKEIHVGPNLLNACLIVDL